MVEPGPVFGIEPVSGQLVSRPCSRQPRCRPSSRRWTATSCDLGRGLRWTQLSRNCVAVRDLRSDTDEPTEDTYTQAIAVGTKRNNRAIRTPEIPESGPPNLPDQALAPENAGCTERPAASRAAWGERPATVSRCSASADRQVRAHGRQRDSRLAQRAEVAFDRANADLEVVGQLPCRTTTSPGRAEFLHHGVEPIDPVHASEAKRRRRQPALSSPPRPRSAHRGDREPSPTRSHRGSPPGCRGG
jgi:hypothetical protein